MCAVACKDRTAFPVSLNPFVCHLDNPDGMLNNSIVLLEQPSNMPFVLMWSRSWMFQLVVLPRLVNALREPVGFAKNSRAVNPTVELAPLGSIYLPCQPAPFKSNSFASTAHAPV